MEWLCFRLDVLSSLTFAFSLIFLINLPPGIIDPGIAGLAVTYGLNLNMASVVRSMCTLENKIISVERLYQGLHLLLHIPYLLRPFSPTSEHILLAYGRRHSSLLRSVFKDGEAIVPVFTVLEVYRVSDMELVRVLPSSFDEVNVACFHPSPGAGLVYGTKEGKLRILQQNGASIGPNLFAGQNIL